MICLLFASLILPSVHRNISLVFRGNLNNVRTLISFAWIALDCEKGVTSPGGELPSNICDQSVYSKRYEWYCEPPSEQNVWYANCPSACRPLRQPPLCHLPPHHPLCLPLPQTLQPSLPHRDPLLRYPPRHRFPDRCG